MKFFKSAATRRKQAHTARLTEREAGLAALHAACVAHDWAQAKLWLAELVRLTEREEREQSERASARFISVFGGGDDDAA